MRCVVGLACTWRICRKVVVVVVLLTMRTRGTEKGMVVVVGRVVVGVRWSGVYGDVEGDGWVVVAGWWLAGRV